MRTRDQLDAMREKGQKAIQAQVRERYKALGFTTRARYAAWNKARSNAKTKLRHKLHGTYAEASALYNEIEAANPKKRLDTHAIMALALAHDEPSSTNLHARTQRRPSTNGTAPHAVEESETDSTASRAESFAAGYLYGWISAYAEQHALDRRAFAERVGRLLQRSARR